ncbi:MAG: hypothetical protein R3B91_13980 [Planctomycetaceae bacterium]
MVATHGDDGADFFPGSRLLQPRLLAEHRRVAGREAERDPSSGLARHRMHLGGQSSMTTAEATPLVGRPFSSAVRRLLEATGALMVVEPSGLPPGPLCSGSPIA